jgi:hypothetical protein
MAKIRTPKKTLPCVTQEKENSQRHYPARLIMGKKKRKGAGAGQRKEESVNTGRAGFRV